MSSPSDSPPSSIQPLAAPPTPSGTGDGSTLDRVRRAASELFATRGYDGASMADIAARVGVSKATLYNYFASKEDLLLELLDASIEAWKERCRPALEGPGDAAERLRRHLEAELSFTAERPDAVAVVRLAASLVGGELGEKTRARLERHRENHLRRMVRFFTEAAAAGEVRAAAPRDLALTWQALSDGLVAQLVFLRHDGGPDLDRVPEIWSALWHGLAPRTDSPDDDSPDDSRPAAGGDDR